MESLLAEINAKKASLGVSSSSANGAGKNGSGSGAGPSSSKYQRRAEVEAAQEEAARLKREQAKETLRKEKEARESKRLAGLKRDGTSSPAPSRPDTPTADASTSTSAVVAERTLPPAEISRRLRQRGKPIRFFGETDKDRFARLRALELSDTDGRGKGGGRTDEYRNMLKGVEEEMMARDSERQGKRRKMNMDEAAVEDGLGDGKGKKGKKTGENADDEDEGGADAGDGEMKDAKKDGKGYDGPIDLSLLKTDISKLHPQVYWYWKNLLKEWEAWLDERPDDVKRSMDGRLASANWMQSSANLKPLFKQLRTRTIPLDVLAKIAEIALESQHRQYQKANDAYLRLSIGTAAWPIGVTSVGMHERGARERIYQDGVAHVLNDEVSRKWIQAMKRLLTFCQMVRPPKENAQRMG